MRTRRNLMLALVVTLALLPMTLAPMVAAAGQAVLAQAEDPGEGGEGQQDPEAQTGADEAEGGAAEEGPVWTYQMARMGLALMVLLLLGVGFTYRRFVSRRQRTGA